MTWSVEWDDRARRELRGLDRKAQQGILRFLRERIATEEDPRPYGRALTGDRSRLWRHRVGQCRLICSIDSGQLVVLVVRVGHRKQVYR